MTLGICEKSGCTVAETGICLLSHEDLTTCPHYSFVGISETASETLPSIQEQAESILLSSSAARRFPSGLELGTEDASEIMRARYTHLVGILGAWGAGKTCFLLSLYLLASRGVLSNYLFAGSETLQGFEARARHLRKWRGGRLPEKLADHTRLDDPRQPALLHIALRASSGSKRIFDVMLTDLPGEWSDNLIKRDATATQFQFLRRADGLILVIDGPRLKSRTRHAELHRSRHLLERLARSVEVETTTPLVLLVSKYDLLDMKLPPAVSELEEHAKSLGFSPEVVSCAAFSNTPETVANGLGVFEALEKILLHTPPLREQTALPPQAAGLRAFITFGHQEK